MNYFDVLFAKKQSGGGGTPTLITKTITENGTYTASSDNADGYSQVTVAVEGFKKKSIANTPTDIASFNDGTANPMPSLEISIVPVQSGSGDPSPSNVRSISGWSGVDIANISEVDAVKYFKGLTLGTYAFVEMSSLSWTKQSESIFRTTVPRAYGTGNFNLLSSRYTTYTGEHSTSSNIQALVDSNGNGLYVNSGSATFFCADSAYTDETVFKDSLQGVYLLYQLANPTTPTITPTQFNTLLTAFGLDGYMIPISWETEAGIVYGGRLNVTTGELTATHTIVDLGTRSYTWSTYGSNTVFYCVINDCANISSNQVADALCSCYAMTSNDMIYNGIDKRISIVKIPSATYATVRIANSDYTDVTAFTQSLSNQKLVYPLATPQTYQLTPVQVTTLLGQNNIFANCGQILEGEYFVTL